MAMSQDEWRQWRQLEAQLAQHRPLVRLARHFEAGASTRRWRTFAAWAVCGAIGLALIIVAADVHNVVVGALGAVILAGTLLSAVVALIVVEVGAYRCEHSQAHGRVPQPPMR